MAGDDGSPDRRPKRGRMTRAVDAVAEWLFPDPTARVEEMARYLREQEAKKKDPPKG